MNCQEFWNAMSQTAPPQMGSGEEMGSGNAGMTTVRLADSAGLPNHEHLAHCPGCAARLRSYVALQKGLRAVASQMGSMAAPPRVEARLREAFRTQAGMGAGGWQSTGARARWMPVSKWTAVFSWATAAAALFAVAAFLSGGRQPELASPAVSAGVEMAVAGMPAEIETDDGNPIDGRAPTDGGTSTDGGAPVVESGFIPLPNAAQIGPNEEVNLVRVEVPRSAMIALGYDVKPEEASGSVQADVMLGNDGLARAVRFLD
ncbi:MAG TPA: hypothetical protein VNY05_02250 [Candidatus Acidoferrales bacterium]|nr:hypothetical protein [Candidatus Acidoferrales bacterium]